MRARGGLGTGANHARPGGDVPSRAFSPAGVADSLGRQGRPCRSRREYDRAVGEKAEPPASFRLDGRVAVVIGGTGALGSRMAGALAEAGARTVVVGRDATRAEQVLERLVADGVEVAFEPCDVSSRTELRELVRRVLGSSGRVDVLVNGAGLNSATPFLEIGDDELERLVAVNQLAVVRSCQEFGRYFVERATSSGEGASIVNVGSLSGLTPLSRVFTYSLSKAAVHNLTKSLAREWAALGIRCNVLVPGFFPAEQNRAILSRERSDAILAHTPMARFGDPEDLAGATLLLASDAGRFITGIELVVDGGFSATTI
jgi:NAD(P)-dependent dehydrogenase (short-subunit alcohol dehydrogenase family)